MGQQVNKSGRGRSGLDQLGVLGQLGVSQAVRGLPLHAQEQHQRFRGRSKSDKGDKSTPLRFLPSVKQGHATRCVTGPEEPDRNESHLVGSAGEGGRAILETALSREPQAWR